MKDLQAEPQISDMLAGDRQAQRGLEDLLHQIVACAEKQAALDNPVRQDADDEQVVFTVHLDGLRYTLTCSQLEKSYRQVGLSPREKEIVRLITKGLPNKAISEVLDISPWTVATHLRRIFAKLTVSSRAEMVARVLREGLLEGHS